MVDRLRSIKYQCTHGQPFLVYHRIIIFSLFSRQYHPLIAIMFVSLRSAFIVVALIASTALGNPVPEDKPAYTDTPCTTTLTVAGHFTSGPTSTVWTTTTTQTNTVDCGTCKAVTTKVRNLGVGPVVHYTTTVTAKGPATASDYVCKK